MWIPKDAADVEAALTRGELVETAVFDAKKALPTKGRGHDLAVDVAAMSTDGGVLLYGVLEDAQGRPTGPAPIDLVGARERVDQIISSSIAEPPTVEVRELPLVTDPGRGFLAIVVPASPRAPHQVVVNKDLRFYGRAATGNRLLTEGEIARLYARRERWEVDRDQLLDTEVARAPLSPHEDFAYLHAYVRPVAQVPNLVREACPNGDIDALLQELLQALRRPRMVQQYAPDIRSESAWQRVGADAWRLESNARVGDHVDQSEFVRLDVELTGTVHLFCGRAAESHRGGRKLLFEPLVAGTLASAFSLASDLYERARYVAPVDIGLALTGLLGVVSSMAYRSAGFARHAFSEDTYRRTLRVVVADLKQPTSVVEPLMRDLLEAVSPPRMVLFAPEQPA